MGRRSEGIPLHMVNGKLKTGKAVNTGQRLVGRVAFMVNGEKESPKLLRGLQYSGSVRGGDSAGFPAASIVSSASAAVSAPAASVSIGIVWCHSQIPVPFCFIS